MTGARTVFSELSSEMSHHIQLKRLVNVHAIHKTSDVTIIYQNNIFTKCYIRYREVPECERAEPGPPCLGERELTAQAQELKDTWTKAHNSLSLQGAAEIQ